MTGYPFERPGRAGMSPMQIYLDMLGAERVPPDSPFLRPFPRPQSEIEVLGDFYMEIFGPKPGPEKREKLRAFQKIQHVLGMRPREIMYIKLFYSLDIFLFASELGHRVSLSLGEDHPKMSSSVHKIQRGRIGLMMNKANTRKNGPALHWGRFLHALAHAFLEIELGRHVDCGGLGRVHEHVFYALMCIIDDALNREVPIVRFGKMDAYWIYDFGNSWYRDFKRSMAADLRGQRGPLHEGYGGVPGFGGFGAHPFNANAFDKFAYQEEDMDQRFPSWFGQDPDFVDEDSDLDTDFEDEVEFGFDPFGSPPPGGRSYGKGGPGKNSDRADGEGGGREGFDNSKSGPGSRGGSGSGRRGDFDKERGGYGGGYRSGFGGGSRGGFDDEFRDRFGSGFRGGFGGGSRGGFGGGFRGGFGGGGSNFEGGKPKLEIDPYKVLGLTRNATAAEIRKAYHKMARDNHPDRVQGGEKEKEEANKNMADINLAHEVLSDEKKKQDYDNGLL
ncbi:DnaJ-domain-containing protein [Lophium mytilinum]|uniref:DnaJ-domain-containing protein n=1 Tax=Lophium mytilinum TaxID=390894 RepID=A0A6A6R4D2_9PEZI|nr:DnaJ-domain-containing protein [Lophium mytilinum]